MAFVYAARQSWKISPWIKLHMISTKYNSKLCFSFFEPQNAPLQESWKIPLLQPDGFFSTDEGALAIGTAVVVNVRVQNCNFE